MLQVSPYVFSDCAHLTSLNLSHNLISQLFHDSLTKCPLLKRVDLSDNRLTTLADALPQASAVRRLDVSRNRLELLQWNELPPRLEHLIADSNIITLLGAATKSKVRSASLRGNLIEQLSADQIPDSIEQLDLAANRVQHIAPATFASKTLLRSLDLSDNRLSELSEESLLANGVHSIDVSLRGNPLRCSCEFHWIKKTDVVKRKVNVVGMSDTLCTHPVSGKVITMDKVDTKDLLCNYSQVCEPDCVCCQFGNCDCKALLDLSDNAIVRLSGDEFHKTTAISHLFLNGNRLQTIERGLADKLPMLTTVCLNIDCVNFIFDYSVPTFCFSEHMSTSFLFFSSY
ncbi:unnamed protein product [Nippostrongylus brasiliensis]|uniref:Leucine Rich repeat-containing domain protein n=1 Tax=Nippostrongylus brasiliensis TaxID=27835 RepID=A0A3P7A0X0_NIPBR|nr:unnamed protein product [Nippostrongylus brasiliensis]